MTTFAAWSLGPDPKAAGFHVAVGDGLLNLLENTND